MNFNGCIVSQVHIPDHDVQGDLHFTAKINLVDFGIEHLRKFNPDSYIILTGHGHRPFNLHMCNYWEWDNDCQPLNEHGYVIGMPAQFKYVSAGLKHAKSLGFKRVLKTRGDCVIGIPGICTNCDNILDSEQKKLLITQQSGPDRMGDCFMYGDLDLLDKIWDGSNQVWNDDGLQNTAINFRNAVNDNTSDWEQLVKSYCSFRDVDNLAFTCLRWNWRNIYKLDELLDPTFNFSKYHWGRANNWHLFDAQRNMTASDPRLWSEKRYYEK